MEKIMVIATLKLNDENLLDDWRIISAKITEELVDEDGFLSRDVIRGDDGVISCILKWESKEKQEKFMNALIARTDEESLAMMAEFGRIVDAKNMTREYFKVL